jgi:hypothetical protein
MVLALMFWTGGYLLLLTVLKTFSRWEFRTAGSEMWVAVQVAINSVNGVWFKIRFKDVVAKSLVFPLVIEIPVADLGT